MECEGFHSPQAIAALDKNTNENKQLLARPTGFEPVTPAFGGRYSIQLSYGRIKLFV